MNISLLLQMAADGMPDRVAIGSREGGLTYAALLAQVQATSRAIANAGVERVAFLGQNSAAFPVLLFGSALSGRPFVPLNYRLADDRLRVLASRTAPSLLVTDDEFASRVAGISGVNAVRASALFDCVAGSTTIEDEASANDIALLLFTSGTTGEPKSAILRHRNLVSYVLQSIEFMEAGDDEAQLISVPPYHIAGVSAVLTATYSGRRVVQLPIFSPEAWLELAVQERVTHAMVVPTMLGRILEAIEREGVKLPDLRHLSYGGGRMPLAVIGRAMTLLPHVDFVNAYGLTETSSTICILDPHEHRSAFNSEVPELRRRLNSVGRPLPGVEIEIRDSSGARLEAGVVGEVWVRGTQVSGEYVGRKSAEQGGWIATNDCGWQDGDGYLFLDGRLDDVIVRGGENISPGEIEDVLRDHGAVRDAAVLGLPDDEWGESIAAVVVTKEVVETAALQDWVKSRLRSTKVPQFVQFREELPYNETGKLLRRVLKEQLVEARKVTALSRAT